MFWSGMRRLRPAVIPVRPVPSEPGEAGLSATASAAHSSGAEVCARRKTANRVQRRCFVVLADLLCPVPASGELHTLLSTFVDRDGCDDHHNPVAVPQPGSMHQSGLSGQ